MPKVNLCGTYCKLGSHLFRNEAKNIDLIVSTRQNTSATKPSKFLLMREPTTKARKYVSSIYHDPNGIHFDYQDIDYLIEWNADSGTIQITER